MYLIKIIKNLSKTSKNYLLIQLMVQSVTEFWILVSFSSFTRFLYNFFSKTQTELYIGSPGLPDQLWIRLWYRSGFKTMLIVIYKIV